MANGDHGYCTTYVEVPDVRLVVLGIRSLESSPKIKALEKIKADCEANGIEPPSKVLHLLEENKSDIVELERSASEGASNRKLILQLSGIPKNVHSLIVKWETNDEYWKSNRSRARSCR